MTEQEWLGCADPTPMLEFLRGKASERKVLLFGCGSWRLVWRLIVPDETLRRVVEAEEQYADGLLTKEQLNASYSNDGPPYAVYDCLCAQADALGSRGLALHVDPAWDEPAQRTTQAALLRCIFGNPFRPVTFDPLWRTPEVVRLAHAIYDRRAFDLLPEFADVLEVACCTDADILAHCRGPGPHTRGCWVVDLLIGKE